jgi:hypothetical protein
MKRIGIIVIFCISFLATACEKNEIEYPAVGYFYGVNALAVDKTTLNSQNDYSFAAFVPEGCSLKIILRGGFDNWYFQIPTTNWTYYSDDNESQSFEVINSGVKSDFKIHFNAADEITFEYYENGDKLPTRIKIVTVK